VGSEKAEREKDRCAGRSGTGGGAKKKGEGIVDEGMVGEGEAQIVRAERGGLRGRMRGGGAEGAVVRERRRGIGERWTGDTGWEWGG